MPFVGLVGYPRQCQTKHKETLDKNQAIKMDSNEVNHTWQRCGSTLNPVLVRGVVSRVQTALPSIRIRLRNLRPGFHPIYPKREKYVPHITPLGRTHDEA